MWMCKTKTERQQLGSLKEALRMAAAREHRSIANMVEVMIRDYCGRVGVPVQVTPTQPQKDERKANSRKG